MAKDTAHPAQHTERAHGEQEPSGQGHRTCSTTQRAGTLVDRSQVAKDPAHTAHRPGTLVNRSQVAKDTAHATQHTEWARP